MKKIKNNKNKHQTKENIHVIGCPVPSMITRCCWLSNQIELNRIKFELNARNYDQKNFLKL